MDLDPALKALCLEVLGENVDSERFASLLIETGVSIEEFEWSVANRLLEQGDVVQSLSKRLGQTVH